MNRVVWKVSMEQPMDQITVEVPFGAELLDIQYQPQAMDMEGNRERHKLMSWWLVDTEQKLKKNVRFFVVGTGWDPEPLIDEAVHVKTVQDGLFVWHVFQVIDPKFPTGN